MRPEIEILITKSRDELAEALRDCFTAVQQVLNNFIQFLHQLAND